ncbi:alanine--glyoxylate aminotransferase family protein [Acaryochloris sp. IP29b_bin.137]|uniref:pyridoxal-phosphate-dependent aminotransferase family protein n=1 Tax=Acaryochloris sp. IP29b_bin.137 TaxID=2969217 RepID=UPI0026212DCC|nr:alanine--glyoxylate aminotransferase family protein [Acaryochloris sp. IP29b_bin.137]
MENPLMLMIPGPTPVPEPVLFASAKPPISHRSQGFRDLMAEITANLKWLHQTQNDVLILASSGTGAMEAGIINVLSPGDRVLVGCNGKFGDRWAQVCEQFGLITERITVPWGEALDPEVFRQHLEADREKQIKGVIVTHSETSTGVLNDLETISRHIQDHGQALSIIDAVTSLGICPVPVDEWGLDVVVSASQKGYRMPPGLGFVCVSPRAWQADETARFPRFYLDLGKCRTDAAANTTPFTPPVNLYFALQVSLAMMKAEGLPSLFAHQQRLMQATRAAVRALELPLLVPDDRAASPAVTAIAPDQVAPETLRFKLQQQYGIVIAAGQDHMRGKLVRIGHLGYVCDRNIITTVAALEATLNSLGYPCQLGAGIKAAHNIFSANNF